MSLCRDSPARIERADVRALDDGIFKKLWRWARRRRGKSARWVKAKYFTRPGDASWRFHGVVRDNEGGTRTVELFRARTMPIRRPVKIRGTANPYDPAWELYFEERLATQMTSTLTGPGTARYLWLEQNGKCPICAQPLTLEEGWHVHHLLWRTYGGTDELDNRVLLHPNCHRQVHHEGLVVERPRPARGVRKGLSRMRRKAPVQFLGEGARATEPPYPTSLAHGRKPRKVTASGPRRLQYAGLG